MITPFFLFILINIRRIERIKLKLDLLHWYKLQWKQSNYLKPEGVTQEITLKSMVKASCPFMIKAYLNDCVQAVDRNCTFIMSHNSISWFSPLDLSIWKWPYCIDASILFLQDSHISLPPVWLKTPKTNMVTWTILDLKPCTNNWLPIGHLHGLRWLATKVSPWWRDNFISFDNFHQIFKSCNSDFSLIGNSIVRALK